MHENNDLPNLIAILGLILAILGIIIAATAPVLGPLSGLILAAFLGGAATGAWMNHRLRGRD